MKKTKIVIWILLSTLLLSIYGSVLTTRASNSTPKPKLYVDPASVTGAVGSTFTINVKISDVTDLYGVDIQFTWDPTIIRYVSHQKHIPVETYPDGILHSPTVPVKDDVDESASMPGAAPGTRYWLAEASMIPADPFSGDGIVFNMTFEVVDVGSCLLEIVSSTLSDSSGNPIDHDVVNGEFSNVVKIHDIAVTDVSASPTSVVAGDSVFVDVTVENLGDFSEVASVTAFYDGGVVGTRTDLSLNPGDSVALRFEWDTTGVAQRTYVISASASIVEGEDENPDNNFLEDGTVTILSGPPPPPPITGKIEVQWGNYSGYPDYPFGGQFHNGEYPVWKNLVS